jgi:hypothetical protein
MTKLNNFQMSIFGSYSSIIPEIDLMTTLSKALGGNTLIPSTINVIQFPSPNTNNNFKLLTQPRIQMIDDRHKWPMTILPNRIDIVYTDNEDENSDLLKIASLAFEALKFFAGKIDKPFGRIGQLVGYSVIASKDKIDIFYRKLLNDQFLNLNDQTLSTIEWQVTYNQPTTFLNKDQEFMPEKVNVGTNILASLNPIFQDIHPEVKFIFDINTSSHDISERFNKEDLDWFCPKAIKKMTELKERTFSYLGIANV